MSLQTGSMLGVVALALLLISPLADVYAAEDSAVERPRGVSKSSKYPAMFR
jgi:hypothetical protein